MSDDRNLLHESNGGVSSSGNSEDSLSPDALAPAYVFEATDPGDTEAVREAMAQNAAVGEEVQAYRRLFNAMLHATPAAQPSPAVGESLLRAIQPPVAPIAQRYPGSTASVNPQESMQVVPLITPPGGTRAVATAPVNPLTGKPGSPPSTPKAAPAPTRAPASQPNQPQKAQPKSTPKPVPRPVPYQPPSVPKATQAKVPPQYATTMATVGKRAEAIPAGFALTPIAPASANQGSRVGMWAASGLALVALALLFVSNSYWASQTTQLQSESAQLQSELVTAQQDALSATNELAGAQQQLDARAAEVATLQGSLATVQQELVNARTELDAARIQIADTEAAVAQVQTDAGGMAIPNEMVNALVRGPMEQASLASLNTSEPMSATARILWNPEMERGMLVAMEMPPLDEGEGYQVWLLRAGVPTSVGVFTVDDQGMGMLTLNDMNLTDYEVAAITTEPMAGSPAPTGAVVIAGEL